MRVIVAAVALLMPPGDLAAELAGSRVRVTTRAVGTSGDAAEAKLLIGTLAAFDGNLLTLSRKPGETVVVVPADRVLRLETLVRPSRKKKGAAIGATLLGGAMLAIFGSLCASDWGCDGADPVRVAAVVLVPAAIGAGVGASVAPGDRWREVPLAGPRTIGSARTRISLGLTPDKRGVTASVSLPLSRPHRGRKR